MVQVSGLGGLDGPWQPIWSRNRTKACGTISKFSQGRLVSKVGEGNLEIPCSLTSQGSLEIPGRLNCQGCLEIPGSLNSRGNFIAWKIEVD